MSDSSPHSGSAATYVARCHAAEARVRELEEQRIGPVRDCRICKATVANGGRENLHYRPVLSARVSPRGIAHWVNNMGVTLCGKDGRRWPVRSKVMSKEGE